MSAKLSSALVSTDWLAQHLGDSHLRVFDCTVFFDYDPDKGALLRGAQPEYEIAHIPGAAYLDLYNDLANHENNMFMMPSPQVLNQVLSAAGLGDDHQVVLYSSNYVSWATRLWWMLRASGFTHAAVLDGGLPRWKAEGRPIATGQESYPAATFTARPDPARWADKETVLAEIGSATVCTINTLSREEHLGTGKWSPFIQQGYGRKGRIKGSLNVPTADLLTEEGLFAPVDQLTQAFTDIGALSKERIICYCGGGISATTDALALHLIGYENVAVYDGSMNEWGRDHSLPMETG